MVKGGNAYLSVLQFEESKREEKEIVAEKRSSLPSWRTAFQVCIASRTSV